jgi:hypothetical protein
MKHLLYLFYRLRGKPRKGNRVNAVFYPGKDCILGSGVLEVLVNLSAFEPNLK